MNTRNLLLGILLVSVTALVGCVGLKGNTAGSTSSSGSQQGQGPGQTPYQGVHIPTWHNDNARTGLNSHEVTLTPDTVNVSRFGKLFSYQVDGHVYAQPLYVSNVPIGKNLHNVVYVATEHDSVYAFDADDPAAGQLWKTSLLHSGETPITGGNPSPWVGITSTPVIDVAAKTIYVVGAFSGGKIRVSSLDIESGAVRAEAAVTASVPSTLPGLNGQLQLTTACLNRAALLLTQGTLFVAFGGCPHGWILSYDIGSLHQIGARSVSPNAVGYGQYPGGGGIWGAGAGPATDDQGNIFVVTGDGPNDQQSSWGMSVLKLNRNLDIVDSFTPFDAAFLTCRDLDLGGAGVMLIPGTNNLVVGGKNSKMFVLNRGALGHQQGNDAGAVAKGWYDPGAVYQQTCTDNNNNTLTGDVAGYRIYGTAAFFNGSIYVGADPGPVKKLSEGLSIQSTAPNSFGAGSLGTTPFISANGTSNGIVWAIDHGAPNSSAAVLHAYDALDLQHELYSSAQNPADAAGLAIKFTAPIVANGKVYLGSGQDGTTGRLDVYGILPHTR